MSDINQALNDAYQRDTQNFDEHDQMINDTNQISEDIKDVSEKFGMSFKSSPLMSNAGSMGNDLYDDAANRDQVNWDEHDLIQEAIEVNKYDIDRLKQIAKGVMQSEESNSVSIKRNKNEADEYIYNPKKLKTFDNKIDVCKWFTRRLGTYENGKYDVSIRKNGIMANPTVLLNLAAENAYNFQLAEFAGVSSESGSVKFTYGTERDPKTQEVDLMDHNTTVFNNSDGDCIADWYLSAPYAIPHDWIEDWTDERALSYKSTSDDKEYKQITSNTIVSFDPRLDGKTDNDIRLVAVVIGAGKNIATSSKRPGMITAASSNVDFRNTTVAEIVELGETDAKTLYDCWADSDYSSMKNVKLIYCGLAQVDSFGAVTILYENYYGHDARSRYHIVTCGAQIMMAKYLLQCDEEEIVDFGYDTMHSFELSRSSTPKDDSQNWENKCIGIEKYGTNTATLNTTGVLSDVLKCACWNDNTYCIYALWLHIYKGLTNTKKDSISPLIESVCSVDDGHIEISFPEARKANVETASGESGLKYEQYIGKRFSSVDWTQLENKKYNDVEYTLDLTNNNVTFTNLDLKDHFTLTISMYITQYNKTPGTKWLDEYLIAKIGEAEIYFCSSSQQIYPTISYKQSSTYKSQYGIKIVDGDSQIYLGIGQMVDSGLPSISTYNFPTVISVFYNHGIWGIHKCHVGRGRN